MNRARVGPWHSVAEDSSSAVHGRFARRSGMPSWTTTHTACDIQLPVMMFIKRAVGVLS